MKGHTLLLADALRTLIRIRGLCDEDPPNLRDRVLVEIERLGIESVPPVPRLEHVLEWERSREAQAPRERKVARRRTQEPTPRLENDFEKKLETWRRAKPSRNRQR